MYKRVYKLKKSQPDARDFKHTPPPMEHLPSKVDLRPQMPPILDQQALGSCTANAASNVLRFLLRKSNLSEFQPSRLFIYWNTRVNIENMKGNQDSGCCIRDISKSIQKYHSCDEKMWTYDVTKFNVQPPIAAYNNANLHSKISYAAVPQDLNIMKLTLASGLPIIVGIQVYDSFETENVAATGLVPIPNTRIEKCMGGHCVVLVGYCDDLKQFIAMNSWGPSWGDKGFFYIPYAFMLNPSLADDFWVFSFFG